MALYAMSRKGFITFFLIKYWTNNKKYDNIASEVKNFSKTGSRSSSKYEE